MSKKTIPTLLVAFAMMATTNAIAEDTPKESTNVSENNVTAILQIRTTDGWGGDRHEITPVTNLRNMNECFNAGAVHHVTTLSCFEDGELKKVADCSTGTCETMYDKEEIIRNQAEEASRAAEREAEENERAAQEKASNQQALVKKMLNAKQFNN